MKMVHVSMVTTGEIIVSSQRSTGMKQLGRVGSGL